MSTDGLPPAQPQKSQRRRRSRGNPIQSNPTQHLHPPIGDGAAADRANQPAIVAPGAPTPRITGPIARSGAQFLWLDDVGSARVRWPLYPVTLVPWLASVLPYFLETKPCTRLQPGCVGEGEGGEVGEGVGGRLHQRALALYIHAICDTHYNIYDMYSYDTRH